MSLLADGNELTNSAGTVRIKKDGDEYTLTLPAARATGGKFWQDPALNRAMVGGEFAVRGGMMRAEISDFPAAFARLKDLGATVGFTPKQSGETLSAAAPDLRVRQSRATLREAAMQQAHWKDWYEEHKQTIENLFDEHAEIFQKFLGATSQAATVKANVALALKAYGQWIRGEAFEGYLPAVIGNLNRIRVQRDALGPKISEYQRASTGDENAAVVDRHIARTMFGTDKPNAQQITKAQSIMRELADEVGWTPRQIQASLWAASIVKSGQEPQSYAQYLARIHAEGTLDARIAGTYEAGASRKRSGGDRGATSGEGESEGSQEVGDSILHAAAPERATPEQSAAKTARPWKATTTYNRAIEDAIESGDSVLDYGSGPYQNVRADVEGAGAKYTPYDKYHDINPNALRSKYDVVMGSNVLNVASKFPNPERSYNQSLDEMTAALNPGGRLVVNMPTSGPLSDWMTPARLQRDLESRFKNVSRKGETFVATEPEGESILHAAAPERKAADAVAAGAKGREETKDDRKAAQAATFATKPPGVASQIWDAIKTAGSATKRWWGEMPAYDTIDKAIGQWLGAGDSAPLKGTDIVIPGRQKAAHESRKLVETIVKQFPNVLTRQAISRYMEADGDRATLQKWAD
jgi:hypothetical protein